MDLLIDPSLPKQNIEKFFLTTLNIFNRIYFNSYYPCLLNLKMGSQQSTRRLTVVNDEAAGVIKVVINTVGQSAKFLS